MFAGMSAGSSYGGRIMALEIEQRYKVDSVADIEKRLAKQNINRSGQQHIIDQWFIPKTIHSRSEHDRWFDEERGIAYRIRRIERPGGSFSIMLDSKQLTEAGNHNTFHEEIVLEDDYEAALRWTAAQGYYNWLAINKVRFLFDSPDPELEVIIDTIDGLKPALGFDSVIEIEYKGNKGRDEALNYTGTLAASIDCQPEDRFKKSLTVAAMAILARFR